MAIFYFPSCKFKVGYPETSKKMAEYVNERFGMTITGCCRGNLEMLSEEDTAICICNTCAAFCDESSKASKVISILEIIANDKKFPFPDYKGEEITIQDCWRTYDKRSVQDAVRKLMQKMNVHVVELPENFEKTRYCGISLLQPLLAYFENFAPKRFIKDAPNELFLPHTDEEKMMQMRVHCAELTTDRVACYCKACADGLNLGGKKAVHMMELLFGTTK